MLTKFKLSTAIATVATMAMLPLSANALTLQQSVSRALQDNPDVQVRVAEKLADKSRAREAYAGYLPTLDLQAQGGWGYFENQVTRANGIAAGVEDDDDDATVSASFSLRQMIFDGWETSDLYDSAVENSKAASYRLKAQAEIISLDVTQAYLEVVRRSNIVQLARENVDVHKKYHDLVSRRANSGVGSVADVSQAQSRLGEAESTLSATLASLRDGVASYKRLVGQEPQKLVRPETPLAALPVSLESAVERAVVNNPTVVAADFDVKSAYYTAESTKGVFMPRFDVEVDGSQGNDVDGDTDNSTELTALLVARYNLYNGGADTARQRVALYERSRAQALLDRVTRLVEEETKFAWHEMLSARDRAELLSGVVTANTDVRDAYLQQFEIGSRSLLDLLDSENDLFVSRTDLVNQRFSALFGSYRVLTAMGGITDAMQIQLPEHYVTLAAADE